VNRHIVFVFLGAFLGLPLLLTLVTCGFENMSNQCNGGFANEAVKALLTGAAVAVSALIALYVRSKSNKAWLGWVVFLFMLFLTTKMLRSIGLLA